MTRFDDDLDESTQADESSSQISLFRWMLLASAAAFGFGGFPLGSTVLTAALAARPAFETAQWILQKDPHPVRGRVCALFHVSVGIWHGFPAALITIGAFIFAGKQLGMGFPLQDLQATLMGLIAAVGISALVGGLATFGALRTGLRVWAHPRFEAALQQELQSGRNVYTNHAVFVLATSLTIPVLIALPLILMTPKPPIVWVLVLPVSLLSVIVPCLMIGTRIFAESPRAYFLEDGQSSPEPRAGSAENGIWPSGAGDERRESDHADGRRSPFEDEQPD